MNSRRLLIIDDHAVVREGIARACSTHFDFEISEAATLSEAIARCTQLKPDVIVVDINLPDGTGLEFITWCRSIDKEAPIVVLTLADSPDLFQAVISSGANALVSKASPLNDLTSALKAVIENPRTFISFGVIDRIKGGTLQSPLTPREMSVLEHLSRGGTISEVAAKLHISQSTLKTHTAHIYEKLGVRDRTSALNRARHLGVIDQGER